MNVLNPASLEVIDASKTDLSYRVSTQMSGFLDRSVPGFLVDARGYEYDVTDVHEAFEQTRIVDVIKNGLTMASPERTITATDPTVILGSRDLNYHYDSVAPSPSIKYRIHYAARGIREVLFSNTLPGRFLTYAENQGYVANEHQLGQIERSSIQYPGMFAIFVVSGGVVDKKHLITPTKHKFTTIDHQGGLTWGRADVLSI